jgi:hypothetical protein
MTQFLVKISEFAGSVITEISSELNNHIHSFINGFTDLLQFRNPFYTDGRTPWTGDEPVARPLPKHRIPQTQNKSTHRHPCLEWDSNRRTQRSNE